MAFQGQQVPLVSRRLSLKVTGSCGKHISWAEWSYLPLSQTEDGQVVLRPSEPPLCIGSPCLPLASHPTLSRAHLRGQ